MLLREKTDIMAKSDVVILQNIVEQFSEVLRVNLRTKLVAIDVTPQLHECIHTVHAHSMHMMQHSASYLVTCTIC